MATTFSVLYLGVQADIDTFEFNNDAENASALVGLTFGSAGSPLCNAVQSFSPGTGGYAGGTATVYDQGGFEKFRINGGADQTFDAVAGYNVTLTYTDGTTASATVSLFQDTSGKTYLAPQPSYDPVQAALQAKPIRSITVGSVAQSTGISGLTADRYAGTFLVPDGHVDGTAGNDSMGPGHTDAQGDQIDGADGDNDLIYGGAGSDTIDGGAGNDTIYYGSGGDTVYGGAGNDVIDDAAGSQGSEADLLYGGDGSDTIYAGGGNDTLSGDAGSDVLYAEGGDDRLYGGADSDTLYGGDGNDTLAGGSGGDLIDGGAGSDFADYADEGSGVFVDLNSGVTGGAAAGDTLTGIEGLIGSGYGDTLQGGTGNETFYGGAGNDSIRARAGNDVVYGGAGDDTIEGNEGNDLLYGEDGADRFRIEAGFGSDTIWGGGGGSDNDSIDFSAMDAAVSVTFTGWEDGTASSGANALSFDNIEAIVGSGHADIIDAAADGSGLALDGGGGADTITGGSGDDTIGGGAGDDVLAGGGGNDLLTGGAGADRYAFASGSGNDTITDFDLADDDEDGRTNDQLDVTGLTGPGGAPLYARDVVVSDDGAGNALLSFPTGETIRLLGIAPAALGGIGNLQSIGIPCFAAGTRIRTPAGSARIETLVPGDLVMTRDAGAQPILWAGRRMVDSREMARDRQLRPVRIAAGALGNGAVLRVSGQHGVLISLAGGGEALVRASHLAGIVAGVTVPPPAAAVAYHHLLLPQHALIEAEGLACESFYPGPWALRALDPLALGRLIGILPALALVLRGAAAVEVYGPRIRPLLTRREVRALLAATAGDDGRAGRGRRPAPVGCR